MRLRPCGGGKEFYRLRFCCGKAPPKNDYKYEHCDDDVRDLNSSSVLSADEPSEVLQEVEAVIDDKVDSNDDKEAALAILDDESNMKQHILGAYKLYLEKDRAWDIPEE